MARIAFLSENLTGCINPTFALARKLTERGHRISYLVRPDLEDRVRAQGFESAPFLEAIYPKGSFDQERKEEAEGGGFLRRVAANAKRRNKLLLEGEVARMSASFKPELFIVDAALAQHGMAAWATGVPTVMFYHQLPSFRHPTLPPLNTTRVPARTRMERLANRAAWTKRFAIRRVLSLVYNPWKELRALARAFKFPQEKIDFRGEFWPRLELPEIVFCPKEFEFPEVPDRPDLHYLEPSVDFERQDPPFPWERLDPDKPLIFLSLGTLGVYILAQESRRMLQLLMDALALHPEWQGVISIGEQTTEDRFKVPKNVVVCQNLPQLAILKRCVLSVNHGGLNTIKESVMHKLPMVILPLFNDQPGNAARVEFHKLGVRANPFDRRLTPEKLAGLMVEALTNPTYKANVERFSRLFYEREKDGKSVELIEQMLARAGQP